MGGPLVDLHMDFTLIEPVLGALEAEQRDLAAAWEDALRVVDTGEGGLGAPDTLSRAFAPGYVPRADALRAEAALRLEQFAALVRAGFECTALYRRGDRAAAVPFPVIG